MSDSEAAIKALENPDTSNKLVELTKNALNGLGAEYQWIKAHVDNKGNEMVDIAGKTGRKLSPNCDTCPSRAHIKQ